MCKHLNTAVLYVKWDMRAEAQHMHLLLTENTQYRALTAIEQQPPAKEWLLNASKVYTLSTSFHPSCTPAFRRVCL
eukprot:scaffold11088_cov14-Tisochrysis_lutea.AAC.2